MQLSKLTITDLLTCTRTTLAIVSRYQKKPALEGLTSEREVVERNPGKNLSHGCDCCRDLLLLLKCVWAHGMARWPALHRECCTDLGFR